MRVLGLISGTSHDGVDAALVEFDRLAADGGLSGRLLAADSVPYPDQLRTQLTSVLPPQATSLAEVCRLDTAIGQFFAQVAAQVLDRFGPADLVVSHGQTVYHWVEGNQALGTLQLGQPAWLAERLGCPVLSDLRARDIAAGGHGAPLASLIDALVLGGRKGRAAGLNLGGIANITVLTPAGVQAYDTGPANALIDAVVVAAGLHPSGYDEDGAIARRGRIDHQLLADLEADPYYLLPPPKSTGKEHFHADYLRAHLDRLDHAVAPADQVATMTALTVSTVAAALRQAAVELVMVSGGGAHNQTLMAGLAQALPGVEIVVSDSLGLPADAKEAILMALIGWCTWHGQPGVVTGGTGAPAPRLLGSLTPGRDGLRLPQPTGPARSLSLSDARSDQFQLRDGQVDDLAQVVEIFLRCWRHSYRQILPQPVRQAMTDQRALDLWRTVWTPPQDGPSQAESSQLIDQRSPEPVADRRRLVLERAGRVAGFTLCRLDGDSGMIGSLYVDPALQGQGCGRRLLAAAETWLKSQGATQLTLWAFAANAPGLAFYAAQGWRPDGAERVEPEFGPLEIRLRREPT
ncbi:MAG: anhydro-N-acetylmuramic acid kinase [Propionibacteriaceae bacterium]|jgi:anhydro-N-acetylmuramic acid kinase|nr:anhydro-N-acetylmuramic acid kinase [Propionibacteriaceae bacterium]